MKKREFNKILKECSSVSASGRVLSSEKIDSLPNSIKDEMVFFLVRNRGPVLENLISNDLNLRWLSSCGYLYRTKSKINDFVFIHTSEQTII
jgi:hypothetical protein